jgi:hypothetical protein
MTRAALTVGSSDVCATQHCAHGVGSSRDGGAEGLGAAHISEEAQLSRAFGRGGAQLGGGFGGGGAQAGGTALEDSLSSLV